MQQKIRQILSHLGYYHSQMFKVILDTLTQIDRHPQIFLLFIFDSAVFLTSDISRDYFF